MIRIHYFQHVAFEGLAAIEDWCEEREASLSSTRFYEEDFVLPTLADFDLLIVMGGPMSVNDESQYPWLSQEKRFIKACIDSGKSVLGICLGAQLIASAMGARVYANATKEIGWFPIRAVNSDVEPQFFPENLEVFHWHGETFDLPKNSRLLASSDMCLHQAFIANDKIIGLQFHLEMNPAAIEKIVSNCQHELVDAPYIQSKEKIFSKMDERSKGLKLVLYGILDHFVRS